MQGLDAARTGKLSFEKLLQALAGFLLFSLYLWPKYVTVSLGPLHVSPFNLAIMLGIALGTVAILVRRKGVHIPFPALIAITMFFVYLAVCLSSDLLSHTRSSSIYADTRFLLLIAIIFPISIIIYSRNSNLSKVADSICICMIIIAGIVLVEVATKTVFPALVLPHLPFVSFDDSFHTMLLRDKSRDGGFRAQGVFNHPIVLGEIGAAMLPLAIARFMVPGGRKLAGAAIVACLVPVMFCGSRTGQVAAVAGLVAFAAFFVAQSRSRSMWLLAILTLPLAALSVSSAYYYVAELVVGRSTKEQGSSEVRAMMWERGWPEIWHNPILGHGAGNAPSLAGTVGGDGLLTIDDFYLSTLLDSGFLGLFTLMAFAAFVLFSSLSARGTKEQCTMRVGFMAGLVAILTAQKAVSITQGLGFFMFMSGLLIASQIQPVKRRAFAPRPLQARQGFPKMAGGRMARVP